jgi:hypothetical protein
MMSWMKTVLLVFTFAAAIYATSYISRLPESNCTTSEASDLSSDDHFYKATLLKKECNKAETTFYSIRIDKLSGPADRRWFLIEQIEQDPYPARPSEPRVKWDAHKLEIEISAKEYSGSIERRVEDLTIVRSYIAPKS